ncbi:MAG: NAD-dependent deacylase [Deltaproteobacteria bacterium]|nr:NAD-dependent deacylase [Deltaproteobacteria bacterium]MBW2533147.1 NAD-dependent deacylase [Deltaproteobacteria bacterium]
MSTALVERRHGVALTGAGISVPSGIPDFRSSGGLWERFDPMEYATIDAFLSDPDKVWRMLVELDDLVTHARPNPAHRALAELEQLGVLDGIVTQNVDNLHQDAGSTQVVEFHGNGSRLVCLACEKGYDVSDRELLGMPPRCSCGKLLKPDVVLFGEAIPERAFAGSQELTATCAVLLVVGTSATVMPCALIPRLAMRVGAMVVEVNVENTELSPICDVTLRGDAAETLPALVESVRSKLA